MSQLEMESLLHYEHNLAACYEAEYLLELSLQRELIRNSVSTDWPGYTDAGETRTVSPQSPSPSTHRLNEPAEGMDVLADSPHTTHPLNHTTLTKYSLYGSSVHPPPSPASLLQPSVRPHTVTPHPINEMDAVHLSNSSLNPTREHDLKLGSGLSLPAFQNDVISLSSVWPCTNGCHVDGPERKRRCLQRPEM